MPRVVANVIVQTIYTHGPPKRFFFGHGKTFVKQVITGLFLYEMNYQMLGWKVPLHSFYYIRNYILI